MEILTLIILSLVVLSLLIFLTSKISRIIFAKVKLPLRKSIEGRRTSEPKKQRINENVQFTVYRPRAIEPEKWYTLLAITHLSELPDDAAKDDVHPKVEVERMARGILGADVQAYRDITADSKQALPREGILTFIPDFQNITFVPDRQSFLWKGKTHPIEFSLSTPKELEGETIRGCVRVYWAMVLLAEINLSIEVNGTKANQYQNTLSEPTSFSPYRRIFASYSHSDSLIVDQFEHFAASQGDEYLRDIRDIRAGEVWNDRLEELIRQADVFQLFWSSNSMRSRFVQQEWEYALSLKRSNFIRPTYWEEPMPVDQERGLPPEVLLALQFKRFWLSQDAFAKKVNVPHASIESNTKTKSQIPPPTRVSYIKTLVLICCLVTVGMMALLYKGSRLSLPNTPLYCKATPAFSSDISPTDTVKAYYDAANKKDVAGIKKYLSKGTIRMMELGAKKMGKSLDDSLKEVATSTQTVTPKFGNEKITGDTATVDITFEGETVAMPLVKEGGEWKIAIDKLIENMRGSMGGPSDPETDTRDDEGGGHNNSNH